jgi:FADH2 O2-dependent halogenase
MKKGTDPVMVYDVALIGAGFGGSLMGLILQRLGLRSVLIDRTSHPRFAIGESATPIGDLIWSQLARQYDLPRLAPLAEYGSWQRTYPDLPCGLKRGFSYFLHRPGQRIVPSATHDDEMLVAASQGIDDADTHWYRAAFDQFICDETRREGVDYFDQTQLVELQSGEVWELKGTRLGQPVTIRARFLIDASGEGGFLAKQLGLTSHVEQMQTNSRPLFAHFRGVPTWSSLQGFDGLAKHPYADHPYPCDDAVLHHQFDGGWMWVIPFNNGITSVGFALDQRRFPLDETISPAAEWDQLLTRYPSIGDHLKGARICGPSDQLVRGRRMQRWLSPTAGPNWALLPTAATFLDPLHSTGNAHTLSGIERLAGIFSRYKGQWHDSDFHAALQNYHSTLQAETRLLDRVIHGCFLTLGDMDLFEAAASFYFVAAIWAENRRRTGVWQSHEAFLGAHDAEWMNIVQQSCQELCQLMTEDQPPEVSRRAFVDRVRERIAHYNLAGLCDPARRKLYPYPV